MRGAGCSSNSKRCSQQSETKSRDNRLLDSPVTKLRLSSSKRSQVEPWRRAAPCGVRTSSDDYTRGSGCAERTWLGGPGRCGQHHGGEARPVAIGAVALGNAVYYTPSLFGIGLLLGLDTLVSQAYGRTTTTIAIAGWRKVFISRSL